MSKKAVVHIGTDKTGSSAIQNTLYAGRDSLLSDEQILYPSLKANLTVYLGTVFRDTVPPNLPLLRSSVIDANSIERTRENILASLESDLDGTDWKTVVISAEGLSRYTRGEVHRFVEWLKRYASDDMTVVAYVRHPVDWTRSSMQQSLKTGKTLGELFENPPAPKWRNKFTPWLEAVGHENFRLVSFEEARQDEGVVASFCDAAGLPKEKVLPFAPAAPVNESMSREAVLLLDSLNRQRPLFKDGKVSPERNDWRGTNVIMPVPGGKFRLSGEQEAKSRVMSRRDLEWLNETFGVDLYPDIFEDPPPGESVQPETMPQETVDALVLTLSNYGNRIKKLENQVERLRARAAKADEKDKAGIRKRFLAWLRRFRC